LIFRFLAPILILTQRKKLEREAKLIEYLLKDYKKINFITLSSL